MADDTVQQVVGTAIASSVNPHPSLVQQRRSRRQKQGKGGKEHGKREEQGERARDKVTLTSRGEAERVETSNPDGAPDGVNVTYSHEGMQEGNQGDSGKHERPVRKIDVRI